MKKSLSLSRPISFFACFAVAGGASWWGVQTWAAPAKNSARAVNGNASARPLYDLSAKIDWELLTLAGQARVTVPASPDDALSDASFFLFANADGVGGAGANRKNLSVESVHLGAQKLIFSLQGPVLRVQLPSPQTSAFELKIVYNGVIPRASEDAGGMGGLLGTDVSGLLGMGGEAAKTEKKNTDYGLYTASKDIVSLGAFWYPTLAVRENGKWADAAPQGLGDVAYAQKSDYRASIDLPENVTVVAPGSVVRTGKTVRIVADDVRELAVLASDNFASRSKTVVVGGKNVVVSAFVRRENAAKLDSVLNTSGAALQIFSKRFGNYEFPEFRVVEAPMRGGAGGMEYSRMIGISSSLFGSFDKQIGGMMSTLNLPGADALLKDLEGDAGAGNAPNDDAGAGNPANVMGEMMGGILGQQRDLWDSLLETTLAHEVAHQWWAIGVGSDSQRQPFVDESLTNWSAILYFEDRYGRAKADAMSDLHLKTSFSMGASLGGGDRAANLPTTDYANNLQYGAVIYGKAALFYARLRELVGDEAFFGALREYYADFNGKIADQNSLRGLILAGSPQKKAEIEALYARWIEGAHGQEDIGGGLDLNGILGGMLGLGGGDE